ncbi:autotransporter domain-containing protein [Martelella lutilitoris]
MEFDIGPYSFTGGALTLTSAAGGPVKIDVTDASATVTMGVELAELAAGTQVEKDGPGTLELTAVSSYTGQTSISAGTLILSGATMPLQGAIDVANVAGAALAVNATQTMTFGTSNVLTSGGSRARFNIQAGTVAFNSQSPGFSGITTVSNGATLTGTGELGGTVLVQQNATLEAPLPTQPTLTAGTTSLFLQPGANLAVTLNATPPAPGTAAPIATGILSTGTNRLMVTVQGGGNLADGTYPLIDYATTYNGDPSMIDVSSVPVNNNTYHRAIAASTAGGSGTLVLAVGPDAYSYWNGVHQQPTMPPTPNGAGGPGTWNADMTNWTNPRGDATGPWAQGGYAIFATTGGAVDVDSRAAVTEFIKVAGMEFNADGYSLRPQAGTDSLVLMAFPGTNAASITVGQDAMNNPYTATIGVALQGTVGLTKNGPGTLGLTTANSYQGDTLVNEGTLEVTDAGAVPGDISISQTATWNWAVTGNQSFDGVISSIGAGGGGTFNVNAGINGSLQLTAANTFTGVTNVPQNVTLNVTGPAGSPGTAALLGTINVMRGGTLQGYGALGDVHIHTGGKYVFGVPVGNNLPPATTLTAQSLAMDDGSTFVVGADFSTNSVGMLTVANEVHLDTGTIYGQISHTKADPDLSALPIYYPVIQAPQGSTYNAAFQANGSTFEYSLKLVERAGNPGILYLEVGPAGVMELCAALPSEACGVVSSIRSLAGQEKFWALRNIRIDEAEEVLPQLSGDVYASSDAAMVAGSRYLRNATGEQVRGSLGGVSTGAGISAVSNYAAEPSPVATPFGAFEEDNGGIGVWAAGYGAWSSMDGSGVAAKMTDSVGGFFLGADAAAFGSMRFGAVAGFGQSTYKVDAHNAKGTSDDYTFGLYGGGEWGGFGVDFGTAYTWHSVSTNRSVYASTFTDHLSGSYDAGTFQVYGGLGYGFDVTDSFTLEPYADAAYINQHSDAFTETGGIAALSYQSQTMNTGFTTVGLRGAWEFDIGGYQNRLSASAGWRHGFGDLDPQAAFTFAGSDPFGVTGTPLAEDQAVLSIGWDTQFSDTVSVGVNYTGQFAGGNRSQNVTAKLNIRF